MSVPDFSWPWAAAFTATLVAILKGLERVWNTARTVEQVYANSQECITGIRDLQKQFAAHELSSTEAHARTDERLNSTERRLDVAEEKI